MDPNTYKIPEESLFGILSGEEPIPIPKGNESAFEAIQGQLDDYIVDHLPKEFWGSRFYINSNVEIDFPPFDLNRYSKHMKRDRKMIKKMITQANLVDMNLLRFYNKRFSRTRTSKYLDELCERFGQFVDEE